MIAKKEKEFYRKETIIKEQEARRTWTAKFDPWLIDEYRQVRFLSFRFFFRNIY
jgi:hypothetical protein